MVLGLRRKSVVFFSLLTLVIMTNEKGKYSSSIIAEAST